jgi:uncharacterized protein
MMAMFPRRQELPRRSFLLLGPRATGKTTWLRSALPDARWFNLLLDREVVRLTRDPEQFRREIEALPKGSWVVVDEVQKLPALLDEVHDLLSLHPKKHHFALTGSSARKLRRGQANLLAGRVLSRRFFPLVAEEMAFEIELDDVLRFGCLPLVQSEPDTDLRIGLLEAYYETYVAEEIRSEALVRNLGSFTRFLEVAALMNGQVVNVAAIARDAGVARPTVQGYFETLVDTLIGTWLPAHRPRARVKETAHPKFYFFDPGVARSLAGRNREPLDRAERGPLFETYVLHELRAFLHDNNAGGELAYWRTASGSEVDFIWSRGSKRVAIEVKASERWRTEDGRALKELARALDLERCVAVYEGARALKDDEIDVLPLKTFLRELIAGKILGG